MTSNNLVFTKLQGYSGIRLKDNQPLVFRPGINLLVGRNGTGKTNMLWLIRALVMNHDNVKEKLESSFLLKHVQAALRRSSSDSMAERFGEIELVRYSLLGKRGYLKILLSDHIKREYQLENFRRDEPHLVNGISLKSKVVAAKHEMINALISPPKFEMTGNLLSSRLFATEPGNKVHEIMEGPFKTITHSGASLPA